MLVSNITNDIGKGEAIWLPPQVQYKTESRFCAMAKSAASRTDDTFIDVYFKRWIPVEVGLEALPLKDNEIRVLLALIGLTKVAYDRTKRSDSLSIKLMVSLGYIACRIRKSVRQVRRIVKDLEHKGYIRRKGPSTVLDIDELVSRCDQSDKETRAEWAKLREQEAALQFNGIGVKTEEPEGTSMTFVGKFEQGSSMTAKSVIDDRENGHGCPHNIDLIKRDIEKRDLWSSLRSDAKHEENFSSREDKGEIPKDYDEVPDVVIFQADEPAIPVDREEEVEVKTNALDRPKKVNLPKPKMSDPAIVHRVASVGSVATDPPSAVDESRQIRSRNPGIILSDFEAKYKAKFEGIPHIVRGRDMKLLKMIIDEQGFDEVRFMLGWMMDNWDVVKADKRNYVKERPTIRLFYTLIPYFLDRPEVDKEIRRLRGIINTTRDRNRF